MEALLELIIAVFGSGSDKAGTLVDAILLTAGTIFEVVNIMNAIKQKRQPEMADVKHYECNEDIEDADFIEI